MSELERKYKLFKLTEGFCDRLRQLSGPQFPLINATSQVVLKTIIVENGERRTISKEIQVAKLV